MQSTAIMVSFRGKEEHLQYVKKSKIKKGMDIHKINVGHKGEFTNTEKVKYRTGTHSEREENATIGDRASNSTHQRGKSNLAKER